MYSETDADNGSCPPPAWEDWACAEELEAHDRLGAASYAAADAGAMTEDPDYV